MCHCCGNCRITGYCNEENGGVGMIKWIQRRTSGISLFGISSILLLFYMMPFIIVIINSMKTKYEILDNAMSLPKSFNLQNYVEAFKTMNFLQGFINSITVTVVSVTVIVICSSMLAYFLVRWEWKMNKLIFVLLVVSMIIPFQVLMIPFVKIYGELGLLSNKWNLVFFYLGFGTALATFMYHGFIKKIPVELEEAAIIDGASPLQVFFMVVFPLLKPITTTIVILDVLWIWNDFLLPNLVLATPNQKTLPLSMFFFFGKYSADYGIAMAALAMTVVPVLIFYLVLQKRIINGVVEGSIK
jgi:raffinose/stachyose/melibiose transport system permease protein